MHKVRTRIKFCGMTSVADALLAAELGVDAIGLIFHKPSSRSISLPVASAIAKAIPPFISRVGVVVNENSATIHSILNEVPIDILQFHGQESAEFCDAFNKPYIKVIHVDDTLNSDFEKDYKNAIGFLFDTKTKTMPGGSGLCFNWQLIPKNLTKPIILAGGLNLDNISQALDEVNPFAVDVTTGIEREKGIKDLEKMQLFIAKVTGHSVKV